MIILLTIFQYLIQATVDLMDKFLITARKIEPVAYTFYTVAMGLLLVLFWPWSYFALPVKFILLNLFSGAVFSLAMYVFFKALSQGEASRVVPYVFALVPVFDVVLSLVTGRGRPTISEVSGIFLLVPGALLISHQKGRVWGKYVIIKTVSALLFSLYYLLWQYGAQNGPVLNNLIWNRIGAAAVLLSLLVYAPYRKKIFAIKKDPRKKSTSAIFLFKQVLGGANFIFLSFLFVLGKISVINALQGFRYVFLLLFSLVLSKTRKHLIAEEEGVGILSQKSFGVILVFAGTLLLFI
ncbi:MAG: EamA family transporter [Patescibacteria group bacterium]|mgnify:FL=1